MVSMCAMLPSGRRGGSAKKSFFHGQYSLCPQASLPDRSGAALAYLRSRFSPHHSLHSRKTNEVPYSFMSLPCPSLSPQPMFVHSVPKCGGLLRPCMAWSALLSQAVCSNICMYIGKYVYSNTSVTLMSKSYTVLKVT